MSFHAHVYRWHNVDKPCSTNRERGRDERHEKKEHLFLHRTNTPRHRTGFNSQESEVEGEGEGEDEGEDGEGRG
jgi:hypothetical protein